MTRRHEYVKLLKSA